MKSHGLIARLGSLFKRRSNDGERVGWWRPLMEFGGSLHAGQRVNESTALNVSTVFACARNISEDVAKLPLHLYSMDGDNKRREKKHPLYRLLHDAPNPEMSSMDFRQCLTGHMLTWGNGYAEIEWANNNRVMALWPIHPRRVAVKRNEAGEIYYEVRPPDGVGETRKLAAYRMFHVRNFGPDGCLGYSPVRMAAESIGAAMATDKFASSFFGNNAWPGFALEHPGVLDPDAREALRKSFEDRHQGADRAFRPMLLQDGMKLSKFSVPPDEAQFLETRQFAVEEICRWYRMPPHKVQQLLRSHYNNIEHQSIEYVTDTLLPWLVRWENEIRRKLVPDQQELFAEHSVEGILRGDSDARAKFYNQMFQIGALSTNAILRLENMNDIGEEGDQRFVMANLVPLTAAAKMAAAKSDPNPPPDGNDDPSGVSGDTDDDNGTRNLPPDTIRTIADAFVAPLRSTVMWMLKKEATAMEAATKREADIAKWADNYYSGYVATFRGAIIPLVEGVSQVVAAAADKPCSDKAIADLTRRMVESHVIESRSRMFECKSWGESRAESFARKMVDGVMLVYGVADNGN